MTPHPYTEDQLVEQPAIRLFAELGWRTVSAMDEVLGEGGTLGRETRSEVVLSARLRAVLRRLNPALAAEAIGAAVDELTRDRSAMGLAAANRDAYAALFWFNALLIASNGTESRVGSLSADWERFFEWKRIEREDEPRRVSLEVVLRGTCEPGRLLDLVESFTVFSEHKAGLVKVLGQNHQFLGVNNAIAATLKAREAGHGRGGVFWQTQGSGKSFAMVFYAQKILRKVPGNWSFVVVTDRVELDDQIAKTFKACGAVSEAESKVCHAESGAHLRRLLGENHRYVFTLIHKFQLAEVLCDRRDVIVITDEAHRSQYDTLALNMRTALPNALFPAFTGTPLIAGEERTREVFGDYVSIYDFQQSVEDGATVPLFYENRTPELRLENPSLNDDIYALIEEAELNEGAEARLEHELGRQYHLITRDERLETVAKDIVTHFLGRGFPGKAIVVSIDKATALRMHDKVRALWEAERQRIERELASYNAGSRNIEELFNELLELSRAMTDEQQRHIREHLTEEELTVFDILTRPGPELTPEEREEVKKVARRLLERMKELLTLDWRRRGDARARVKLAIEDALDEGLPRAYSPELYKTKCSFVFQHVYETYDDRGSTGQTSTVG